MAERGAPLGNTNATKGKLWSAAINRALEIRGGGDKVKALDQLAEKLLRNCDEGDMAALKELGDRLDGKPTQTLAGDAENPFYLSEIIRTKIEPS